MAARGIKLQRYQIANAPHLSMHGFRLRIQVAAVAGDMPPDVFVYYRRPADPHTGEIVDDFQTVASFVDLAEYPALSPNPELSPFFRLDYIEVDVRSVAHYQEVWQMIQAAVNSLIAALNRADQMVLAEEVWIGEPNDDASDSAGLSETIYDDIP